MRVVLNLLFFAALIYVALCALLYFAQRSLLYFPTPAVSLPGATPVALTTEGATLRLWTRPTDGADALIYFGGNAEDVATSFEDFAAALPRHALYFVNYRGYGGSSGSPSEAALFADALAVYDHAQASHANIAVAGRSLGSGVAAYLATKRKVQRLVLVTPYDSIVNVARKRFPVFPVSLILTDKFDSASRVPDISAPTLAIVAERDEVIPRRNSDALIVRFPKSHITAEVIPGATHNELGPTYPTLISRFCNAN